MSTSRRPVAVLGAGVIGRSWASLFAAAGHPVRVFDVDSGAKAACIAAVRDNTDVLESLGRGKKAEFDLTFHTDPAEAVAGCEFVQESVPERMPVKAALYAAIECVLEPGAIVASSASGLTLSELQSGWTDPARFVLGHPFNPPHLIPLVEVMGNSRTAAGVVREARDFYESVGKVTIEVRREVPGHVANRLQAALWREAISLVASGVASVADVDTAVSAGPGLRWAVMGPTALFHLGADSGGLREFCLRYSDSFHRWWNDLGDARLDAETVDALCRGIEEALDGMAHAELVARRDALLAAVVAVTHGESRTGAPDPRR